MMAGLQLRILLISRTGVGKSFVGNTLLGITTTDYMCSSSALSGRSMDSPPYMGSCDGIWKPEEAERSVYKEWYFTEKEQQEKKLERMREEVQYLLNLRNVTKKGWHLKEVWELECLLEELEDLRKKLSLTKEEENVLALERNAYPWVYRRSGRLCHEDRVCEVEERLQKMEKDLCRIKKSVGKKQLKKESGGRGRLLQMKRDRQFRLRQNRLRKKLLGRKKSGSVNDPGMDDHLCKDDILHYDIQGPSDWDFSPTFSGQVDDFDEYGSKQREKLEMLEYKISKYFEEDKASEEMMKAGQGGCGKFKQGHGEVEEQRLKRKRKGPDEGHNNGQPKKQSVEE